MINQEKIDEWIREVEERPISAALIIRYIANRLSELAAREEELAALNIELMSGRKVEEYENRIASLEYQLELLKRQLGGEVVLPVEVPKAAPEPEILNLLVYNRLGQALRLELDPRGLASGKVIGKISGEVSLEEIQPGMLTADLHEELLFLFDSGRTVAIPATRIQAAGPEQLGWQHAFLEEPRVKEELASIQPIARMSLYETCIQASRKGFIKRMKTSFLAAHIKENYVGSGVKQPADKTFGLTLADAEDMLVMVSQEGYIFSMKVDQLPIAIEEVIQLGITDHIVSTFTVGQKPSIMFITRNGKAVFREPGWLDEAKSFRSKGQALLSRERRESGTRIIAAAPVDEADWVIFLLSDGTLAAHSLHELSAAGSIPTLQPGITLLGFTSFSLPGDSPKPAGDPHTHRK